MEKGYTLMLKVDGVWKIQDGRCLTKNRQPHLQGKATLLKKNSKNHLIEKLTTNSPLNKKKKEINKKLLLDCKYEKQYEYVQN